MRATCTHYRWSCGNLLIDRKAFFYIFSESLSDKILRKFVNNGKKLFSCNFDSKSLNVIFDDGVKFFDNKEFINLCRKAFYKITWKRIGHSKLENAYGVTEYFFYILIRS